MSKTTVAKDRPLPVDYDALIRMRPLRPIRDDIDFDNAAEVVSRLAVLGEPTQDQADYLEVLASTIAVYEDRRHSRRFTRRDPIGILKHLLGEHNMSGSDLGRLLGNRTLGPAILKGTRELSKAHIAKLCEHFKVQPRLFLPRPAR